eukprot:6167724-Karenia_brevis.AAC.1
MLHALGLPPGADEPDTAARLFQRVQVSAAEGSDDEGEVDADYEPDARGYRIQMADGVITRL